MLTTVFLMTSLLAVEAPRHARRIPPQYPPLPQSTVPVVLPAPPTPTVPYGGFIVLPGGRTVLDGRRSYGPPTMPYVPQPLFLPPPAFSPSYSSAFPQAASCGPRG